tara:strand:+ start:89 stop:217 length:129 start_codon:yes stop_codon:yes gene_type:complete
MEPIYIEALLPSMECYKKCIERYDKGIKEVEFYLKSLFRDFK